MVDLEPRSEESPKQQSLIPPPDLPTLCEIGSGQYPYKLGVVVGVVNCMIVLRLVKKYLDTRAPLNKLLSPNTREFEKRLTIWRE